MGITSTLYTALSGLNASQSLLDVAGNNIANVNTVGYKHSRALFQTQLSQTLSFGTPPGDNTGGGNPIQIGLGVNTGAIQKDFSSGSIETTGLKTDVAIEGSGFFIFQDSEGSRVYSRDGSFSIDANQRLVSSDGHLVLGYAVDDSFGLLTGTLSPLTIPEGRLTVTQATTEATFAGNLDASGTVASTPSTASSEALVDTSTGAAAVSGTSLTNLATAASPATNLFAVGDVITLDAEKGGRSVEDATFTVTSSSTSDVDSGATVGELMEWLEAHLGINTSVSQTPPAGVSIDASGAIQIVSNLGPDNNLNVNFTSNGAVTTPMSWTKTEGDGTSTYTSFQVYDSLGTAVNVEMTFVLEDKSTSGNTWRFFVNSADDSDASTVIGTGTLKFGNSGILVESTGTTISINRADTGAVDPVRFTMDFSDLTGVNQESVVRLSNQNGFPAGTLNDFAIADDGTISGIFTNGLKRTLGQVVLATFSNPEGLIDKGNNTYVPGPNSGEPTVSVPGSLGAGLLMGGALELSNVDMTKEFINMVSATTAFSMAGRVINTSQQLLAELLNISR